MDSFDEFKYYKSKDVKELSENFKKWNADVDRELSYAKMKFSTIYNLGKMSFKGV